MKKLLLLSCALLAFCMSSRAQNVITCDTTVIDTLHYYFNKYYFKTGQTTYSNYPYYKSAASTVTNVTHCGSRFDNIDTLLVTGLEAYAAKHVTTANLKIPVHLYLCTLNNNGMPNWPPLDSVSTDVGGGSVTTPSLIGGNFTTPHKIAGNFAVLFRNFSTVAGDTVHLLRTAGVTATNVPAPQLHKYSDGNYGFIRYLGTIYSTQNFTMSYGFGVGTDYEFMVAPRVKYPLKASHIIPQNIRDFEDGLIDTICTRTAFTFTNTSSYRYTNRFYNLNEFYRKWNLYSAFAIQSGFSADSAITWTFEYEENALPPRDPRTFLPYVHSGNNFGSITSTTDRAGCWDNQFRARLKTMSAFARGQQYSCNINFRICLSYCDKDAEGIATHGAMPNLSLYPNPLVSGRSTLKGLEGKNTVLIYDLLGQLVSSQSTDQSSLQLDLQKEPAGTYLVRITNAQTQTRVVKLINQ